MNSTFYGKFVVLFFLITLFNSSLIYSEIHIRINQVGFLPEDVKSGVILSDHSLNKLDYSIVNSKTNKSVYNGQVFNSVTTYGNFRFTYRFQFTELTETGTYIFIIGNKKSYPFKIGKEVYNGIADSLLQFFSLQRCGYTEPFMHEICHIADASLIIEDGKELNEKYDLTGGWHDAGDYVKFLNTTAYATYTLLLAYDFAPEKFNFDNNGNNVPDILEEAKVGLDWLLRANLLVQQGELKKYKLITQVQTLQDHDVGWRMPEQDPLQFERPAFAGIGKNLIGIYAAALSLGSRIWDTKFNYKEYSDKCLTAAEDLYSIHKNVPDIDTNGTGMYIDKKFYGKLALGAVELYKSTQKNKFLKLAKEYADSAKSDYWWSWGDINSFAHFRLAEYDPKYIEYIRKNLEHFNDTQKKNIFGQGAAYSWGTNNTLIGICLQNILYKSLTNDKSFDTLDVFQRDFILGKNQWGISFIYNIGSNFTKKFHHQIAYFKNGYLPGGFAAGPVTKEFLDSYEIPFESSDKYSKFQTDFSFYRDDRMDYICNEPTISANATAIFVMGFYSN